MLPFYHTQKMLIMGNRDFRDRLNNRKVPMNDGAWSQMESLLDSMPPTVEPRKKRGFIWIFLLFGLLALVGVLPQYDAFDFKERQSSVVTDQGMSSVNSDKLNTVESAKSKLETTNQDDKKDSLVKVGGVKQPIDNNEDLSMAVEPSVKSVNNTVANGVGFDKVTESASVMSQTIQSVGDQVKSVNVLKLLDTEGLSIASLILSENKQSIASGANETSSNIMAGFEIPEEGNLNTSERDQLIDMNIIEESKRRLNWMTDRLSMSSIKPILGDRSDLISMEDIDIEMLQTKDLYLTIQAGSAMFNNNPGYIVGFGLFKDINKLIAASIDVNYAYGSRQNIPVGDPFTFERQLDIGASIHVNLIRTVKSKISIELGLGYAIYGGERVIRGDDPIIIDFRSSRGLSYNVGISYNYFIAKRSFVGVKLGAIAYDDGIGFGMLKFGKAF